MKSEELKKRIAKLEETLTDQRGVITKAEEAVAQAFASAADPTKALAALGEAKTSAEGMIRALSMLDAEWYDTATAEFNEGVDAINADTTKAYEEAKGALEKAIESGLVPVLKKYGVTTGYLGDFTESTLQTAWEVFSARGADRLRELGRRPSEPSPRDASGMVRAEA